MSLSEISVPRPAARMRSMRLEIVLGDDFGFGAQRDVFAEMSEDGAEPVGGEAAGGGERVLRIFARHEAGDGAAHETEARRVLAHPGALRSCQNRAAHQAHWSVL